MEWSTISSNWMDYRPRFRTTFGRISEDELEVTQGRRSRLVDKVRDAYHLSQEEAEHEVDAWAKALHREGRGRNRGRAAKRRGVR